ncbi:GNAT family N-acetyltransferase [Peribacillus alkalitolerans]|uniref:GNAT family N-acetyltransferase n=1 Tax=Peribacillus alkalitolerans TaxID=1550385 RepID=UPI0013D2268F|nr:GNAT family N-acetyltransferase [Peribacillus alkalitolerans]
MNIKYVELIGERVKLVPMDRSHIEGLYKAGSSPEIWTYMSIQVKSLADMERLVEEALEAKEKGLEFPFVVIDNESDSVVGSTRFLNISKGNRSLEIGWTWYSKDVWRTRVNTESKYLLLKYCMEHLETVRVQFKADNRNERSKTAIQRIGATFEGVLRQDRIMPNGYNRDSAYFSVIDKEWDSMKAKLEDYLQTIHFDVR